MRDIIAQQVKDDSRTIDVMKYLSRAALEYIGRGGFGHSFGSFESYSSTPHSDALKRLG